MKKQNRDNFKIKALEDNKKQNKMIWVARTTKEVLNVISKGKCQRGRP
jgi:hypothetical protein